MTSKQTILNVIESYQKIIDFKKSNNIDFTEDLNLINKYINELDIEPKPETKPEPKPEIKKIIDNTPKTRAQIVKEVMKKEGLSLIEASKFVKKHNLYVSKNKIITEKETKKETKKEELKFYTSSHYEKRRFYSRVNPDENGKIDKWYSGNYIFTIKKYTDKFIIFDNWKFEETKNGDVVSLTPIKTGTTSKVSKEKADLEEIKEPYKMWYSDEVYYFNMMSH